MYPSIRFNLLYMLSLWVTSNQNFCFTLSLPKTKSFIKKSSEDVQLELFQPSIPKKTLKEETDIDSY